MLIEINPWQQQRLLDLLYTLRDVDQGENVSFEEIDELADVIRSPRTRIETHEHPQDR